MFRISRAWLLALCLAQKIFVNGFAPFGKAIEGSEQLEAWLPFECPAEGQPCRHAVDPRKVYKHTHPGYPDHALGLGPHSYLSATVRTDGSEPFSVFLHQETWSSDPASAIAHVQNATSSATVMTQTCKTKLFASVIYITIHSLAARNYDFSFTIKKGIMKLHEPSLHMIPPKGLVLLAVPVFAVVFNGGHGYDVTVTVTDTFPPNSSVSVAFVGPPSACEALPRLPTPPDAAATSAWGRVRLPDGDATHAFVSVFADAPKRVLVTFAVQASPVQGGQAGSEGGEEEEYLAACMLGDRLLWRGNLHDALSVLHAARRALPARPGAPARILHVLHAGGALRAGGEGDEGQEVAAGLFPVVEELGRATAEGLAGLSSGRASQIRRVLGTQTHLLAMARRAVAETLAEEGDMEGAERVLRLAGLDHAHLPAHASCQTLWENAMFMKRFGAFALAAQHLTELSRIDTTSVDVHAELSSLLLLLPRTHDALAAAQEAVRLDGGHGRGLMALSHALLMGGCWEAAQALSAAEQAGRAGGMSEEELDLARALVALALLCQHRQHEALAAQYPVGAYAELGHEAGAARAEAAACARLQTLCQRLLVPSSAHTEHAGDAEGGRADVCSRLQCPDANATTDERR